uniref:Uncharacterized protein ycf23 n=1 Tax=Polysiphonia urceolata TaxID=173545 RepID=A0A1Z1MBK5_POLUR|nr:hypothetical protein [Polysiphonia stricta]ARW63477.1 hypothetical protein [Polysiphonia stricta]
MSSFSNSFDKDFKEKRVIKVITGISNTNVYQISKIAKAAELANASYLDVVANTQVVKFLKSFSSLPICVSSIETIDIYNCLAAGADIVEIGNYDFFYEKGIYLNSKQLIKLVNEIKNIAKNTLLCVTIPYYLDLNQQINLAQECESLGVDIIQTEGCYQSKTFKNLPLLSEPSISNSLSTSLLSTYLISKYVDIPVITSSNVTNIFSHMAKFYGASGIGIGSAIRKQNTVYGMMQYIKQAQNSLVNTTANLPFTISTDHDFITQNLLADTVIV